MSSRLFSRSGTSVSVCDPHGMSTNAMTSGFVGSLLSMTCTPSSPAAMSHSPHCDPAAGVDEFHDRMIRFSQMMTSPWLPVVLVGLAHSSQSMISVGLAGDEMSMSRKPEYVPCTATSPQNARSELNDPLPATVLSVGTIRGEYPSGFMFFVYSNVLVAAATPGGTALALDGSITTSAAATVRTKVRLQELIKRPPSLAETGVNRTFCRQGRRPTLPVGRSPPRIASALPCPARRAVWYKPPPASTTAGRRMTSPSTPGRRRARWRGAGTRPAPLTRRASGAAHGSAKIHRPLSRSLPRMYVRPSSPTNVSTPQKSLPSGER